MKRYIIIPCILSIFGHSLFFSVFKTDTKSKLACSIPQLFLISEEQFDYLGSIARMAKDIVILPLPKSLSSKSTIWKDILDIDPAPMSYRDGVGIREDSELLDDFKGYNFERIQTPSDYCTDNVLAEFSPMFGDLFPSGLLMKEIHQGGENILELGNGMDMRYCIQGPAQSRGLIIGESPRGQFNLAKSGIRAKFRLWITKDGRVNQVIIEEDSSFPLIDQEIVNLIKTWHFSPAYDTLVPNYEWGVVMVRIEKR